MGTHWHTTRSFASGPTHFWHFAGRIRGDYPASENNESHTEGATMGEGVHAVVFLIAL